MDNRTDIIDVCVGARIRERRKALSLAESTVAEKLGVSLAELQDMEDGLKKIGPRRLQLASDILGVSPIFFFREDALDPEPMKETWNALRSNHDDALNLAKAFSKFEGKKTV